MMRINYNYNIKWNCNIYINEIQLHYMNYNYNIKRL